MSLQGQPRGPAGSQLGNQAYSKNSCAKHFSPRSCPTVQSEGSEGLTDCQASNWGFPNKAVWPQNLSGRGPLIKLAFRLKGATENTLCHKGVLKRTVINCPWTPHQKTARNLSAQTDSSLNSELKIQSWVQSIITTYLEKIRIERYFESDNIFSGFDM